MTRRSLFREADLARALKVTQRAGLHATRVEITPEGGLILTFGERDSDAEHRKATMALEALRLRLVTEGPKRLARRRTL